VALPPEAPAKDHESVGPTITGVRLVRATSGDSDLLTQSQVRTFDDDARRFDSEPSTAAPPAWTNPTNRRLIANSYYYRIEHDQVLVGGLIVLRLDWSEFHIARIWVETAYQRQGIGSRAMALLDGRFPQATLWTVEAPAWAYQRRHFYKGCGFDVAREARGTIYYERHRKGILRLRSLP